MFGTLVLCIFFSLVVCYFVVYPLIRKLGAKTSTLFMPSDEHMRIVPEYSVAEARAKKGEYRDAVDEYRKVIEKYPEDVYPHLRIAELALNHLQDHKLVETELRAAVEKAEGETSIALAAGRLADFYQLTLNDPGRALEVMKRVCEKIPNTKEAYLATERIAALEKIVRTGVLPPKPPDKIAPRPSRYKMPE